MVADFREKVLNGVSNAGELDEFNATVECKFGGTNISASILKEENKKIR